MRCAERLLQSAAKCKTEKNCNDALQAFRVCGARSRPGDSPGGFAWFSNETWPWRGTDYVRELLRLARSTQLGETLLRLPDVCNVTQFPEGCKLCNSTGCLVTIPASKGSSTDCRYHQTYSFSLDTLSGTTWLCEQHYRRADYDGTLCGADSDWSEFRHRVTDRVGGLPAAHLGQYDGAININPAVKPPASPKDTCACTGSRTSIRGLKPQLADESTKALTVPQGYGQSCAGSLSFNAACGGGSRLA